MPGAGEEERTAAAAQTAAGAPSSASAGTASRGTSSQATSAKGAAWTRFAIVFAILAISAELAYHTVVLSSDGFQSYLRALASGSGVILGWLAQDVHVNGTRLETGPFAVRVADGCDAFQICALYAAAVIGFPISLGRRLRGLILGLLWLQGLNLVRIVTLFWIGTTFAGAFMTFHQVLWPTALVVATAVSWAVWALWETRDAPA